MLHHLLSSSKELDVDRFTEYFFDHIAVIANTAIRRGGPSISESSAGGSGAGSELGTLALLGVGMNGPGPCRAGRFWCRSSDYGANDLQVTLYAVKRATWQLWF